MFTVVIIGKPNVGKSTLFNKLIGLRKAITHDLSGVTRDYKTGTAFIGNMPFELVDTAGLYINKKLTPLEQRINEQTKTALAKADLILFVLDGRKAISAEDKDISIFLRKYNLPVLAVINKCENKKIEQNTDDILAFGHENLCQISAEHNIGLEAIYEYILKYHNIEDDIEKFTEEDSKNIDDSNKQISRDIKISIVGRPNAGKSTCINSLLKEERLITGAEPGITRDSIITTLNYKDFQIKLVDTAGVRKKSNISEYSIEQLSVNQTIQSIDYSDIVVLVIDINLLLENQDLKIANIAIKKGKPLILAVNKIDEIKSSKKLKMIKKDLEHDITTKLSEVKRIPIIYISALKKLHLNQILDKAIRQFQLWHTKISTSKLNEWLAYVTEEHQPPLSRTGTRIRIKYITQVKAKPPSFRIFINKPDELPKHYIKYLTNKFVEDFNLQAIPVKVIKSKSKNPYV